MSIILGKFSQVITGYGLNLILRAIQALFNHLSNKGKIVFSIEKNVILLPESLGVTWTPSKLFSLNLISEFLDGTENLLVLVKVFN